MLILVLALAVAQAAEPAEPELYKPLHSLVPREREIEREELEAASIVVQKFAACVVEKEAGRAAAAVELPLAAPSGDRTTRIYKMKDRMSHCLGRLNGATMQLSQEATVGAFAEQLYRRRFAVMPSLGKVAIPAAANEEDVAQVVTRQFADCLIDRDAAVADALIRTDAGSPGEAAAFKALAPHYGQCLDAGSKLQINRLTLRVTLADQLYRRALAGSAQLAAGN